MTTCLESFTTNPASEWRWATDADQRTPRPLYRPLRWWRELLLLVAVYGVYMVGRGATSTDVGNAIASGRGILDFEQSLHISPEHVLNHALANSLPLAIAAGYFYSVLHYVVTPLVLVWMYRAHPGGYRTARTSLAAGTLIGLVGFYLLPTAPPRLLPSSDLHDTLSDVSQYGWWSNEGSVPRGLGGLSNQFAAMPSLHVGWALWCGVLIAVYASRRWVRWLGIAYPIATTLVVVATGNHYLVDAFAGVAVMAGGLAVAHRLVRRPPADHRRSDYDLAAR